MEEISKQVVNNPESLLTPEIVEIAQCLSERFTKESRFCGWGWALENQVRSRR